MAMTPQQHIAEWVGQQVRREAAELDNLVAEAMTLQDYDRREDLTVIRQDGFAPAVGSLVRG